MGKDIKTEHLLYIGDVVSILRTLPDESVNCCITSPPYWGLRDYGVSGQIGLEATPEEYVAKMVEVFREIRRVLRGDGTLWLNLGDSYAGSGKGPTGHNGIGNQEKRQGFHSPQVEIPAGLKPKDLVGIPWMVAFALRVDGWYLRSDIIWNKPNPMPESVTDRPTSSHEYLFLLSKSPRYYYDAEAIKEPCVNGDLITSSKVAKSVLRPPNKGPQRKQDALGKSTYTGFNDRYKPLTKRNKRDVWTISPQPFPGAHFAVMPEALVEPCIKAGCPVGGTVLDPFGGSGTVSVVARNLFRNSIYIDIGKKYANLAQRRMGKSSFFHECKMYNKQ